MSEAVDERPGGEDYHPFPTGLGTCWRCRWFSPIDDPNDVYSGECRRMPPQTNPCEDGDAFAVVWPVVGHLDWCGEWVEMAY